MFRKSNRLIFFIIILIGCFVSFVPYSYSASKHLIVIDPGHGGADSGVKTGEQITEKDITLAVALAMQKELGRGNDFEVILTRDTDKTVTLEERRSTVSRIKPDVFLSLHINGGFGKNAAGFELYYPGFKDLDQAARKKDAKPESKNKFLSESVRLAKILQKNLDTLFPRKGRGLREAQTPTTEGMNVTAVVVEIGFATNTEDKKKLLSTGGQSEIAKALSQSIKSYFR